MKNIVIIKLYRNDLMQSDYHDLVIEEYEKYIKDLENFAKTKNKELFFSIIESSFYLKDPAKNYAEIEFTGELDAYEKEFYSKTLKLLSSNAFRKKDTLNPYITLKLIKFKKVEKYEEIVFID